VELALQCPEPVVWITEIAWKSPWKWYRSSWLGDCSAWNNHSTQPVYIPVPMYIMYTCITLICIYGRKIPGRIPPFSLAKIPWFCPQPTPSLHQVAMPSAGTWWHTTHFHGPNALRLVPWTPEHIRLTVYYHRPRKVDVVFSWCLWNLIFYTLVQVRFKY
jgi:hypothetical protein